MLIGRQAIVVGAGIGGLCAALALAQRGASVTVLEQADAITEAGAGLQIGPNGTAVLQAMGLGDALAEIGLQVSAVRLKDFANGKDVIKLDVAGAQYRTPWVLVHRADLISLLKDAVEMAGVRVELGARVCGLVDEDRTGVQLSDGRTLRSGLVVAADGVRSELRPLLDGAQAPDFCGQVAWRALVPGDASAPREVEVHMGPGSHLVRYPLRGGQLVNIVAVQDRPVWTDDGWHHRDDPPVLRAAFSGYSKTVQQDLERLETVHLWGLFRRPVARRWSKGRVALLGDSAHATLPFLAQGAVMAIEDAWVLAESLSGSDGVEAGLALYETRRRARCRRIVAAADRNALAYHLKVPGLRKLAHIGLGLSERVRPGLALSGYNWLYRTDVTQG